ncbi:MAG TPA: hypothetical protein VE641_16935 [Chthoniobacterales bacterium]|nr:hypothetical protein [Chthoniobacterales bacterium]
MGEQIQVVKGNQVRSRLVLHFRDGSVDDEVSVFNQTSTFQLVSDHHIQKGPSFPEPMDLTIDIPGRKATWLDAKSRKQQTKTEEMDFPPDLANGMISLVVENFPASTSEMRLSYVAGTPKPHVVKLVVTPDGYETFHLGGVKRRSRRFNLHIEIGGIAGVVATVAGKQPDDIKLWALEGDAPTFLRMKGPMYEKGPTWITELTSPVWVQDKPGAAQ